MHLSTQPQAVLQHWEKQHFTVCSLKTFKASGNVTNPECLLESSPAPKSPCNLKVHRWRKHFPTTYLWTGSSCFLCLSSYHAKFKNSIKHGPWMCAFVFVCLCLLCRHTQFPAFLYCEETFSIINFLWKIVYYVIKQLLQPSREISCVIEANTASELSISRLNE